MCCLCVKTLNASFGVTRGQPVGLTDASLPTKRHLSSVMGFVRPNLIVIGSRYQVLHMYINVLLRLLLLTDKRPLNSLLACNLFMYSENVIQNYHFKKVGRFREAKCDLVIIIFDILDYDWNYMLILTLMPTNDSNKLKQGQQMSR